MTSDEIAPTKSGLADAKPAKIDRLDRRFSIEGDPIEALKAVLVERPAKKS